MQVQHYNYYRYVALGLLLIIGLSDVLDGYLARKRGEITRLGKYLDPIADKLVLVTAYLLLSFDKLWPEPRIPNWIPTIIICKELFISFGFVVAFIILKRKIECRPDKLGRVATFLQVTAVMVVLAGNHLSLKTYIILWWLVAVATLISAINYTYRGVKQL